VKLSCHCHHTKEKCSLSTGGTTPSSLHPAVGRELTLLDLSDVLHHQQQVPYLLTSLVEASGSTFSRTAVKTPKVKQRQTDTFLPSELERAGLL